jgi:outer membrane protein TolC
LNAGLVAPNDVLSVEAQQARQQMLAIRARAARDVAESELARLVGAAPGARIQPGSALTAVAGNADLAARVPMEALVAEARRGRPERAALVDRLASAQARLAAADAQDRPTVAVGGGVDYGRPNPRIFPRQQAWHHSWDASVSVSWPVADGGRVRAEVAEARATVRAMESRLAEFDSVLGVELGRRLREIDATGAAVVAAEAGVRAAAEARRVATERFAAGVATNTDVLNAQGAVLQAELDRTEALAAARLAEAYLDRALGR